MRNELTTPTPAPNHRRRNLAILLGSAGAIAALCLGCLAVAGIVIGLDPFRWHAIDRLLGRYDPLAAALPADTPLYASVDMLTFTSTQMDHLLQAFADVPGGNQVGSVQEATDSLDKNLKDALDLTFTDDIRPWLGQHVGLAVTKFPASSSSSFDGQAVFLVEARDKTKAEAFVGKLIAGFEKKSGKAASDTEYEGVTLHTLPADFGSPTIVARSGNLVLIGNSADAVQLVIKTQTGSTPTLSDAKEFRDMLAQLPGKRTLTLFMNGTSLSDFVKKQNTFTGLTPGFNAAQTGLEAVRSLGMALAVVDEGVRLDTIVIYDDGKLTDQYRQVLEAGAAAPRTDDLLPSGTLVYLTGQRPDLTWASYRETLIASIGQSDYDNSLRSFETQFGFNPDEDLFPYLDGEWALALVPDTDSFFAQAGQGRFGFVALLRTSNAVALGKTVQQFNQAATGENSGAVIDTRTIAGVEGYMFSPSAGSDPFLIYGVGQDYLTLASSAAVFEDLFNGGDTLSAGQAYRQVWFSFPARTNPVFFADVPGLLALARDAMQSTSLESFDKDVAPYIKPVQAIAAGSAPAQKSTLHSILMVFIHKP